MLLKHGVQLTFMFTLVVTDMATSQMTPSQTVQAGFDAFAHGDWQTLASLIHPDAVQAFRTDQLGAAVGYSLLRSDPQMRHRNVSIRPADFVSSDAIQRAKDLPVAEFPGAPTIGELAGLSFTDFFVRWCEAAVRSREKPWSTMQHMGRQIIGTVSEGDTLAHVVYRVQGESIWLAGRLEVMPLKSVQGRWLMLMNDDVIWRFPLVGPH